jgi:hypothetical protein
LCESYDLRCLATSGTDSDVEKVIEMGRYDCRLTVQKVAEQTDRDGYSFWDVTLCSLADVLIFWRNILLLS